ncbi:MAG: hypothetical protein IJ829_05080 [Kiritimatiellae bacterium]|nr:hypothetical protein [Kiritimatiellia bacterium]
MRSEKGANGRLLRPALDRAVSCAFEMHGREFRNREETAALAAWCALVKEIGDSQKEAGI